MTYHKEVLLIFIICFRAVAPYPSRVPSCSVPHPLGHSLLDSSSQTFSNPKGLPVQFNVIEDGPSTYKIIMEGGPIKGYLIRPGDPKGEGHFLVDILHVANDFLKSINTKLISHLSSISPKEGNRDPNTWSVPTSFPPGVDLTTVKDGCVHHNKNFSRGRDPTEKTYMEFVYKNPSGISPVFEAIIVEKFDTWWHKIRIAKSLEGDYQTKFDI